jgi:hypothetical protein
VKQRDGGNLTAIRLKKLHLITVAEHPVVRRFGNHPALVDIHLNNAARPQYGSLPRQTK